MFNCDIKPYLNFIMKDGSVLNMLKLRTGNHKLSIEVDRYRNRKAYNECICSACNTGEIEDIYHVLVKCSEYLDIRLKTLRFLMNSTRTEFYQSMNNSSHNK